MSNELVHFMAGLRDLPPGGQQGRNFFSGRKRVNQRVATETAKGGDAGLTGRCLQSTTGGWSRVERSSQSADAPSEFRRPKR